MCEIFLENVTKTYFVTSKNFLGGVVKKEKKMVLEDISLNIKSKNVVGIIGENGSGKSTLLKLLSKITVPDCGKIIITGKTQSILELNIGFDKEESGLSNIYSKCELFGVSKSQTKHISTEIIRYSGLQDKIEEPLKTYSSGMIAKLAISISFFVPFDILLIDEILSVCDTCFVSKCSETIKRKSMEGKIILLTSHNISLVRELCNKVYWIKQGKIYKEGKSKEICNQYQYEQSNSVETLLEKSLNGDAISQNKLALAYRDGKGIKKDLSEAEHWFNLAIESGSVEAIYHLGELKISSGDLNQGVALLEQASQKGFVIATSRLHIIRNNQADSINEKVNKLRILAHNGDLKIAAFLASIMYQGKLVRQDYAESYYWYEICANSGIVEAQYMLGVCNKQGVGTQINLDVALYWLKKASDQNHLKATLCLAQIYEDGIITESNTNLAIYYYTKAAELCDESAMLKLRDIYSDTDSAFYNEKLSKYWDSKYAIQTNIGTLDAIDHFLNL